jgi:hypothetical protein
LIEKIQFKEIDAENLPESHVSPLINEESAELDQ